MTCPGFANPLRNVFGSKPKLSTIATEEEAKGYCRVWGIPLLNGKAKGKSEVRAGAAHPRAYTQAPIIRGPTHRLKGQIEILG